MDTKQITQLEGEEPTNLTNEVLGGTGESFFVFFVDSIPEKIGNDSHVIRMKAYLH